MASTATPASGDVQVLLVSVIEASGIKSTNVIGKQSDSFVTVHVNEKLVAQTRIVEGTLSPKYNEILRVPLSANIIQDTVQIFVYGSHWWSNEFIGRVEIPAPIVALILNSAQRDTWLKLLPPQRCIDPKNRYPGFIHLGFAVDTSGEPVPAPLQSQTSSSQRQAYPAQQSTPTLLSSPKPNPLQCVAECPICGIMYPQSIIEEHVNSCIEEKHCDKPSEKKTEESIYPPPYVPPQGPTGSNAPSAPFSQPCAFPQMYFPGQPQLVTQPQLTQLYQQLVPLPAQQPEQPLGPQQFFAQHPQMIQSQQLLQLQAQAQQQQQLQAQQRQSQPQMQPQQESTQQQQQTLIQLLPQPPQQTQAQAQQAQLQQQALIQQFLQAQAPPQQQVQSYIQLPSPPPVQLMLPPQTQNQTQTLPQQQAPLYLGPCGYTSSPTSPSPYGIPQPYTNQKLL
ncbi:hypothetical protein Pelo_9283 [Pelomyxa schiedti]|nr:hypothetical protein Pelo_9283 [Pelomyxa schiedti]